jgi:hypothetical protein
MTKSASLSKDSGREDAVRATHSLTETKMKGQRKKDPGVNVMYQPPPNEFTIPRLLNFNQRGVQMTATIVRRDDLRDCAILTRLNSLNY